MSKNVGLAQVCPVLGKTYLGTKHDFEIWAFKVFFSLNKKNTPQNGFQMPRPEYQNWKEYTGHSSQDQVSSTAFVGLKNELVALSLDIKHFEHY